MILTLGLIVILSIMIVGNGILITEQDERIKQLDKRIKELGEQNNWQDIELTRFRERIMKVEKLLQEMEKPTDEREVGNGIYH